MRALLPQALLVACATFAFAAAAEPAATAACAGAGTPNEIARGSDSDQVEQNDTAFVVGYYAPGEPVCIKSVCRNSPKVDWFAFATGDVDRFVGNETCHVLPHPTTVKLVACHCVLPAGYPAGEARCGQGHGQCWANGW